MLKNKNGVEDYIALFPEAFHAELREKLRYKSALEADQRFKIPSRIWLAFLTPPDPTSGTAVRKFKHVWPLKAAMLKSFAHPRQFLDTRDPLHKTSDQITLAVLEILFDLEEKKVLLSKEKYNEWLEIANHFGLWKLRYLLEDAIFKTFDPENFALFESVADKQMQLDAELVASIRGIVKAALKRAGISGFSVVNRRKNICGVYKKVALKGTSLNEIYDIHGFRILAATEKDCYAIADILHKLWPHFPERYKDYIAHPKDNGYQSIHTVLSCLQKKPIEFQIRTYEMDTIAASGPANHAEYKKAALAIL